MTERKIWKKDRFYLGDEVFFPEENFSAVCKLRINLHKRGLVKFYFKKGNAEIEKSIPKTEEQLWN